MQSRRKGGKVVSPLLLPDVLERLDGKAEDRMGLNGVQDIDADKICSLSATTSAAEVAEDSLARLGSLARGGQVG